MKNLIILIAGLSIVILLLQNTNYVTIKFLFWHLSMPKIILILTVFIIGFITGYLFSGKKYLKYKKR